MLGIEEGLEEGKVVGLEEGVVEGRTLGLLDGNAEGRLDGLVEGSVVGLLEGRKDGCVDGLILGEVVGGVGALVSQSPPSFSQMSLAHALSQTPSPTMFTVQLTAQSKRFLKICALMSIKFPLTGLKKQGHNLMYEVSWKTPLLSGTFTLLSQKRLPSFTINKHFITVKHNFVPTC